jgi:pyridoxal phosphate enzyme (YggS family)
MVPSSLIISRRAEILARIARAAERARRDPSEIALLAVTKTHPADVVRAAVAAGLTRFGENRVAEGAGKIEALQPEFPGLEWRLIGPLQTNKAKAALQWFSIVETLDRERLAVRLAGLMTPAASPYPVLVEVNVGGESTKSGAAPSDVETLVRATLSTGRLTVRGLMTVPPFSEDPESARASFRELREIRDRLRDRLGLALAELSMGMSHDFEVAVEEGSTEVRIGTALFGERAPVDAGETA